jgi:hypothetical protein
MAWLGGGEPTKTIAEPGIGEQGVPDEESLEAWRLSGRTLSGATPVCRRLDHSGRCGDEE